MPRFYFHLKSKQTRIVDDKGKDFDTLNKAYEHGRSLLIRYCSMLATMMRTTGKLLSPTMKTMLSW